MNAPTSQAVPHLCAEDGCDRPAVPERRTCERCRWQATRASGPYRRLTYTPDELLDEWMFMRGYVPFEEFGARVGLAQLSWERTFREARAKGDPRATRARNDPRTWPDPAAGLRHVLRARVSDDRMETR